MHAIRWTFLLYGALGAVPAVAGPFDVGHEHDSEATGGVQLSGLVDMRFVRTTDRRSWLYNVGTPGRNKLRYGGKDTNADQLGDRPSTQFAIPQVSLVVDADVLPATKLHVQTNLDADFETGNGAAGLIEAYAATEASAGDHDARLRLGAFIPPLSWEHPNPAWSTRYTLTPSAIASWAGEDLRAFGAEGTWHWKFAADHDSHLTAGIFSGGDQTGWVLIVRGWALHDFQPDLNFTYNLPSNETSRPFKELDGRAGYYGRLKFGLFNHLVSVAGGYWDNNADKRVQTVGSHLDVYHTRFRDAGAQLSYRRLDLIVQGLHGDVESLTYPRRDFDAGFALASYDLGKVSAAGRYDRFRMQKLEKGTAGTGALSCKVSPRQTLSAEYVRYQTKSPAGAKAHDSLTSLNYRLRF